MISSSLPLLPRANISQALRDFCYSSPLGMWTCLQSETLQGLRRRVRPRYAHISLLVPPPLLYSSAQFVGDYPQRPPGQAVVIYVFPSPPRYVFHTWSRIWFSIPTFRRYASEVANSRSRTLGTPRASVQGTLFVLFGFLRRDA